MDSVSISDPSRLDLIRPLFGQGAISALGRVYDLVDNVLNVTGDRSERAKEGVLPEFFGTMLDVLARDEELGIDARGIVLLASSFGHDVLDLVRSRPGADASGRTMSGGDPVRELFADAREQVRGERSVVDSARNDASDRNHYLVLRATDDRQGSLRADADIAIGSGAERWLIFSSPSARLQSRSDFVDFVSAANRGSVDVVDTRAGTSFPASSADAAALAIAHQGPGLFGSLGTLAGERQLDGPALDNPYQAVAREMEDRASSADRAVQALELTRTGSDRGNLDAPAEFRER